MERLQGPVNPRFLGEHLNVECLDQSNALDFSYGPFLNTDSLRFGAPFSNPSFDDKIPFLQMLEGVESPSVSPLPESNFQLLLRLQQQKNPWKKTHVPETDSRILPLELESCITHVSESHSPVKSEAKEHQYPHSSSCLEAVSCCREPISPENCKDVGNSSPSSFWVSEQTTPPFLKAPPIREKRKRKRAKPCKNHEEVESQRMTHIVVERNRRKQMNDHLNALRSLMPSSFIQRGDQASIVGGAIDFVKELEQLLQSLHAQKQRRQTEKEGYGAHALIPFNDFFVSPQYTAYSQQPHSKYTVDTHIDDEGQHVEFAIKNAAAVADIEVTVVQMHVNLKILSPRKPEQLLKAIAALEDLSLAILHLNVTSSEHSVLYSFNLKIEEGCKLGSADEIAAAVYRIFRFINGG
ncbi:transcription factor bHLH57-like [Magnolia sinica]|uniref:transcription factor bHLH57-like n=1 Tax=Magnolia sinica TaxID=86752 RepID=UPI002657FF59|nr:transcription factor bHLH57-like [Magnolia sinica]